MMNIRNNIDNLGKILPQETVSSFSAVKKGAADQDHLLSKQSISQPVISLSDKTDLSTAASYFAQASDVSEVRLDKVASIQNSLQAGTYQVPAADVAKRVIDSLLPPEKI